MSAKISIEVRQVSTGWKVFEVPGVEPIFETMEAAVQYAKTRANFRAGEIRILDKAGGVISTIAFDETNKNL